MGISKGQHLTCSVCKGEEKDPVNHNSRTCPRNLTYRGRRTRTQVARTKRYEESKKKKLQAALEKAAVVTNRPASSKTVVCSKHEDSSNTSQNSVQIGNQQQAQSHQNQPPRPRHDTYSIGSVDPLSVQGDESLEDNTSTSDECVEETLCTPIIEAVDESSSPEEEAADLPTPSGQIEWMTHILNSQVKTTIYLKAGRRPQNQPYASRVVGKWPFQDTFWAIPPNPGFKFDGSAYRSRSYCLKKLFIWVPEYIHRQEYPLGVLKCPRCKTDENVQSEGFNPYGPRPVYDIDDIFYVICKRYRCHGDNCNFSFNGYSPEVLDIMPPDIADEFPAIITHRCAIAIRVINLMRKLATNSPGIGISTFRELLEDNYLEKYYQEARKYHSRLLRAKLAMNSADGHQVNIEEAQGDIAGLLRNPEAFPKFSEEYGGHIPSATLLEKVLTELLERRETWVDRQMQMIDVLILKADATRKIAKRVRIENQNPLSYLYSLFNEYHQVVTFSFLESEGSDQISKLLSGLSSRITQRGWSGPLLCFLDKCCQSMKPYIDIIRSLAPSVPPSKYFDCMKRDLVLEEDPVVVNIGKSVHDDNLCIEISEDISNCYGKRIGLDLEWSVSETTKKEGVSLMQIAYRDGASKKLKCALFRLQMMEAVDGAEKTLPNSITRFLRDKEITKYGRAISQDAKRLKTTFNIQLASIEDVADLAVVKGYRNVQRNSSLQKVVEKVLLTSLDKNEKVRISNWDAEELTDEQITYSCIDAVAPLLVAEKLNKLKSVSDIPILSDDDFIVGRKVVLLSRCSNFVAGLGEIVELPAKPEDKRKTLNIEGRELVLNRKRFVVKVIKSLVPGIVLPLYKADKNRKLQEITMKQGEGSNYVWPLVNARRVPEEFWSKINSMASHPLSSSARCVNETNPTSNLDDRWTREKRSEDDATFDYFLNDSDVPLRKTTEKEKEQWDDNFSNEEDKKFRDLYNSGNVSLDSEDEKELSDEEYQSEEEENWWKCLDRHICQSKDVDEEFNRSWDKLRVSSIFLATIERRISNLGRRLSWMQSMR